MPFCTNEEGMVTVLVPWPMIVDSGGVVGELAFVTRKPIARPARSRRLYFFFRMILMCVGLVMFRKYWGFLHHRGLPNLPPAEF